MRWSIEQIADLREFIGSATAAELVVIRTVDIPHLVGISDTMRERLFKLCDARAKELLK